MQLVLRGGRAVKTLLPQAAGKREANGSRDRVQAGAVRKQQHAAV